MNVLPRFLLRSLASALLLAALSVPAFAQLLDSTPTSPNDYSSAGLQAALSIGAIDPEAAGAISPEDAFAGARAYAQQLRAQGITNGSTRFSVNVGAPVNIRANNPAGDRIGETQGEVAVAVYGDTVVVGWNDSRGFLAGNTVTSFAYSTNGGATFTDGGNVPLALATDQAFGDGGIDTDERGNWYINQIYTRVAGAPGPTAEQDIGVHHGRFNGAGVLVWDPPVMASTGTSATGNLDKCLLACDRVTGNVYVSYTRFTATPQIQIVRSTTNGATWGAPITLDNTTTPTASKQAARPFCGPNGEVYVVWEKGANTIFCPDGSGNVTPYAGAQIAFSRSLDFGATYSPLSVISSLITNFLFSGPGDLRERGNEFPDIAVDRSTGPNRGKIYVTWHDGAPWTANVAAGPAHPEAADAANNNPTGPELFNVGDDCTGTITATSDLDYWQFNAVQGQSYLLDLAPQGFVCGVSGTTRSMRLRLFATQSPYPNPTGFPDTLVAASANGTFLDRIVWTAPRSGAFLVRLQNAGGTVPHTYTLKVRPLTFSPGTARDARDVLVSSSSNNGTTWSLPALVNDDPAGLENRRPFIACDGKGDVHVFWHDSRVPGIGSNAALTNIFGTTSRDGGATWTPNYCVTDELSFFSFNALAVPNLGDYNQAAGNATCVIPAWTDQRISTGDVRTPGTNTYTAGLGPEAYTTCVSFAHSVTCPPGTAGVGTSSVNLTFRVTNNGTVPDTYNYTVSDGNGWVLGGPINGTTPPLLPNSFFDVFVQVDLPPTCTPTANDAVSFFAGPVGDPDGMQGCETVVHCDVPVATLASAFTAATDPAGVVLSWYSDATASIRSWNVYRGRVADGGLEKINAAPIPMASGGRFSFVDPSPVSGAVSYELRGVFGDGSERRIETIQFSARGVVRELSLRLAGANPFHGSAAVAYTLPQRTNVRVDVFNVLGQRVRTLVDGVQDAGTYTETFGLRNGGARLSPGLYMIKMTTDAGSRSVRVMAIE